MNEHDLFMPTLNGPEVRHRAAELAPPGHATAGDGERRRAHRHFAWLSQRSGIPVGTLQNATRDHNPQGITLVRVYDIANALRRDDEKLRDVVAAITVDDVPLPDGDDAALRAAS